MTAPAFPVAIVGASAVSPAGSCAPLGGPLRAGARFLAPSAQLAPTHPGVVGGEVPAIPAEHDVGDRRVHRLMARGARLSAVAVRAAWRDAGLDPDERAAAGLYVGVGASGSAPDEIDAVTRAVVDATGAYDERRMCERGLKVFHPLRTFALMPNFTLCHPAILDGLRGPNAAVFSRGAGTATALDMAAHAIADGDCAHALAAGADTALDCLTWAELVRDGHAAAGLVPGEGAAAIVLAPMTTARPIRAVITAVDVRRLGEDPATAIAAALAAVGARPDDVGVLAAWGRVADAARPLCPPATVDLCAALGDALAATPALAWCAALELAGATTGAVVVTAGPDGHLAAVRFAPPPRPAPPRPARPRPAQGRAVVTGVGAVSGFGVGFAPLVAGLAAGARAIRPITCFDATALAARVGGQVPTERADADFLRHHLAPAHHAVAERWGARGALRDRKVAFALLAAAEAVARAGLDVAALAAAPLALACGLERGLIEDLAPVLGPGGVDWAAEARRAAPAVRNRAPIDLAARAVVELLGLGGPVTVHASACAAGAIAVAHGAALIERGAEVVVCGAADTMLDPIGMGAMIALGTTSPRADALDACRPFDRRRDGLCLGEGAAVFVLERADRARARGARPLATVLGWGTSADGYRPSAPDPDGARAAVAIGRALARAEVGPDQLGYVNAHGTGTPLNDVAEVRALRLALGAFADGVPVSSIKGAVGHLMTAAGAIELAGALLAFERDLLPGTANHKDRDPDCDLDIIGEAPRPARVAALVSTSFGFGGQNAAVVLGRPA